MADNKIYKPKCFGDVYKSFHDCEPCPAYSLCETEALTDHENIRENKMDRDFQVGDCKTLDNAIRKG